MLGGWLYWLFMFVLFFCRGSKRKSDQLWLVRGVFSYRMIFFLIYHRMSWVIWNITCMHSFVWFVFPCNCWICFPQTLKLFVFFRLVTLCPARNLLREGPTIWASRFPHGLASYFTRHQLRLKPILVNDEWWLLKIDRDSSSWIYYFDSDDSKKDK